MKRLFLFVVLLALAAAAWVFLAPYGPRQETFVDIPLGAGTAGIASRLEQAGVIRSRYAFEAVRLVHGGSLKAGEYRFQGEQTLGHVYRTLLRGEVYTRTLAIPEGYNLFDIAQAVERAGLGSSADFVAAAEHDTSLIRDLDPQAQTLEGFLFPDTYKFRRNATPDQIVAAMVTRFRRAAVELGLPGGPDLARTVILASIVEKEVGVAGERPLVAGVFRNRLAAGMKLETDPTVVYAALLAGRWRGVIHQSDLQFDSPYNTYRQAGLPPGPIANPGAAALRAALQPAQTDFLYFVSDAQGHTRFSATLAEHEQQVAEYRRAAAAH